MPGRPDTNPLPALPSGVSEKWKVSYTYKPIEPTTNAQKKHIKKVKSRRDVDCEESRRGVSKHYFKRRVYFLETACRNARTADEIDHESQQLLVKTDVSRNDARHLNRILVLTAFLLEANQFEQLGFTQVRKTLLEKCKALLNDIEILLSPSIERDTRESVRRQLVELRLFHPRRTKSYFHVSDPVLRNLDKQYVESTKPRTDEARKLSKRNHRLQPGRPRH